MINYTDNELTGALVVKRALRTIPMIANLSDHFSKRKCHNCSRLIGRNRCLFLGKIINPDWSYCS